MKLVSTKRVPRLKFHGRNVFTYYIDDFSPSASTTNGDHKYRGLDIEPSRIHSKYRV